MSHTLTVLELAAADVFAAKSRYNELRPGLGNDFALCVDEALARIQRFPLTYATIDLDFRRVLVRRFPFAVYFRVNHRQITVYGVFPSRENPEVWRRRGQ